jgi:hypothetical protein
VSLQAKSKKEKQVNNHIVLMLTQKVTSHVDRFFFPVEEAKERGMQ